MDIFVDKQGKQIILSAAAVARLDNLRLGEIVVGPVRIWLLDRGATAGSALTPAALPAGYTDLILAGRASNDYTDGDLLFSVTEFTQVGSGATLHYEGTLDLRGSDLATALAGRATLACVVDVTMQSADASLVERLVMRHPATALQAVYHGTEGATAAGTPSYPVPSRLLIWRSDLVGFTGGGATKLDGITTVGVSAGLLVALVKTSEGVESHWRLDAGTTAENEAGGIVRPDDYAGTTNEKIWTRIA
jgi:hypothetical protein